MTVYSATKFAVHVLSDGLREELAPDGVRVTVISPGYVQTPIFDDVGDDDLRTRYQDALAEAGLEPSAVADQVVHALDQPAGVNLIEIAMLSTSQWLNCLPPPPTRPKMPSSRQIRCDRGTGFSVGSDTESESQPWT